MIPALLLGRKGSVGFPGKNTRPVLGRPMAQYPMMAAKESKYIDTVYLSTDDENLMELARVNRVEIIKRPAFLCTKEALGHDAFIHGYQEIKKRNPEETIEMICLLFCNAPTLLSSHIDKGIEALRKDPDLDSAITVSQYNWYSPIRARKISPNGLVHPFIPFECYDKYVKAINCDRDAQGDCYFADNCVSVVRPHCLENRDYGMLPQQWMGQKIFSIKNWGGLDVDKEFQLGQVDFWLRAHGFTEKCSR
ncbi:MAG: cytidylyltransferase domain-containing protein [bacterium]